jgi:HPt (histidine-containing phosphotransfer) domain-containing protein
VAQTATEPPQPPPTKRRRFKPADVAEQLDMVQIGDVCIGVGFSGLRDLLHSLLADESGAQAALLHALDTGQLHELKATAHAVKGSMASMGLKRVRDLARQAELEHGDWDAAACAAHAQLLREALDTSRGICQRMGLA